MYTSEQVADRIRSLARKRNVPVKIILADCGMGRNAIAHMDGGSFPRSDNLAKIALTLDCSTDYLLGLTDTPTPVDKINSLTERQGEAILHMTLKDSGLIGPDGQFTPEGAEIVARFITSNADMLRKLINEK